MKKILLITRGIPSSKNPMWGNFELDQAKALRRVGHQVTCLSIDRNIRLNGLKFGQSEITIDGIKMYNFFLPLPHRLFPRVVVNFIVDIVTRFCIKNILSKEGEFDIIHGHYLRNIRIATKFTDTLIVGTEHWSELKRPKIRNSVKHDAAETYPQLDQLITVSYPMKDIIKREFDTDSEFVGCVIDSVFDYVPKVEDGVFRFIAVGSLFRIKGFDIAIKAFSKANFHNDIHFHIIGEGAERPHLEQLIKSLNLTKQVFLEGRKSRGEIMEWMGKSSAYVLSSRSENFATACMEALSAGVPAIMTKCGGPEDFVDESNSILVSVDNVEEMAAGMKYMIEHIDRYDGKTISEDIKRKYSPQAIAEQLTSIYEKISKANL